MAVPSPPRASLDIHRAGRPELAPGIHRPGGRACVMEYVSVLAGEEWSDSPRCTHPVLATAARMVNDCSDDRERVRLVDVVVRLLGTTPAGPASRQQRVARRLALWCGWEVLPLLPAPADQAATDLLRTVSAWCRQEGSPRECGDAGKRAQPHLHRLDGASLEAMRAAWCASQFQSASWGRFAVECAVAEHAAWAAWSADWSLVDFLTGLLDEYDRVITPDTQAAPAVPPSR